MTLPTALERAGDFSRSVDASGDRIVIYDPLTTRRRSGQSWSVHPGSLSRATSFPPIASIPSRANCCDGIRCPTLAVRRRDPVPVSDLANQATIKLDHQVSRALRSSGMFAWYGSTEPSPLFYDGLPSDPFLGDVEREVQSASRSTISSRRAGRRSTSCATATCRLPTTSSRRRSTSVSSALHRAIPRRCHRLDVPQHQPRRLQRHGRRLPRQTRFPRTR